MQCVATEIEEVKLITPDVYADERGFFKETWNAGRFQKLGIDHAFLQDNQSRSTRGVLRGLHYQVGKPQGKLVSVVTGEVFDVAVDLRRSAPTFGKWVGRRLSAEAHTMLWVPPGFAHGFYVLSEQADVTYKCTELYAPEMERTIAWNDRDIGIRWPLAGGAAPLVSAKDARGVAFKDAEYFP
jgi:dTDP-4-dehydrorhamnose 3,5-epimerase